MAKKPKLPKHLEEHQKLHRAAEKAADTTDRHHRIAFNEFESAIVDKNGEVDYTLLDKEEFQQKGLGKLVDSYVGAAQDYFNTDKDAKKLDPIKKDRLMKAYAGFTKKQFGDYIQQLGSDFKFETFNEQFRERHMAQLRQELRQTAAQGIKQGHMKDVIKHVGLEDVLDPGRLDVQYAGALLDYHERQGKPNKRALRQLGVPSIAYKG